MCTLPVASFAQSRTPPAGSSLADTPPVDQKPQQFNALPADQKTTYVKEVPPSAPAASPAIPPAVVESATPKN